MAEKVILDDKQTLRIANLKLYASCLTVVEIVLEDIEGHLDDGEVEHPDRQIAFTQMSRVYSDTLLRYLLYSDI